VKKLILILSISSCFLFNIYSEDAVNLVPLGDDLTTLFLGIGQDVVPLLHQNALSGDTYGEAEIDQVFLPFYLSIPSIGLSTTDGIATVLSNDSQEWKFAIQLPSLVDSALEGSSKEYFDIAQNIFALPTVKLGFGFKLPSNFELHISGIYLPPLDFGALASVSALDNLSLDIMDVGFKLRKTIFHDTFFKPAFSIGAHYYYSTFEMDFTFDHITDFLDSRVEAGGLGELDLGGTFNINTKVQSFGLDFHLSKRLIIFTPFIKLSPTLYYSTISTTADLDATLYDVGTETEISSANLNSGGSVNSNGVMLYGSAGLEFRLLFMVIHLSVNADLQNPTLTLGDATSGDFSETYIDKFGLNLGFS